MDELRRSVEQPYDVWASTLHPEDRPAAERGVAEAARGLRAYEGEFRIVRPGGEIRYIRTASEIKRDDTGRPITMYGVNFDVTESRRADEQFRLALEAASAGMMMVDAGGAITLINAQIEVLFGYTREELIGQRLEKLLPSAFAPIIPVCDRILASIHGHAPWVRDRIFTA